MRAVANGEVTGGLLGNWVSIGEEKKSQWGIESDAVIESWNKEDEDREGQSKRENERERERVRESERQGQCERKKERNRQIDR